MSNFKRLRCVWFLVVWGIISIDIGQKYTFIIRGEKIECVKFSLLYGKYIFVNIGIVLGMYDTL